MDKNMDIGLISGPGALDFPVKINLSEVRNRLIQASHPLGSVPQWNGNSFYMVHVSAVVNGESLGKVCLIGAKNGEQAEEVALNNLRSRNSPDWSVESCLEVKMTNHQLFATLSLNT